METCEASWETKSAAFPGKSLQKYSPGHWRLSHSSHGLPGGKNPHLSSLSHIHPNEAEPSAVAEMERRRWISEAEPSICSCGSVVTYRLIGVCAYPVLKQAAAAASNVCSPAQKRGRAQRGTGSCPSCSLDRGPGTYAE